MAGFGSCLGSLLGMNNQTYGVIAGMGFHTASRWTDGLCLNNIQYYTGPTTYHTATASSVYVMASDGIWQVWNQGFGAGTGNMQAAGLANKRKKALGISWGMVTLALTGRILGLFVR